MRQDERVLIITVIFFTLFSMSGCTSCIGSVMLKAGRNVQAQQFLRRVCELMPKDHRGWGQLSISSSEMHRYEEAIRYAEKALSIRKEPLTYANASFAHTTAGNWSAGARSRSSR